MKRILVVEDEDVIRDFEVINLKRAGYEVVDVPARRRSRFLNAIPRISTWLCST